MGVRPSWSASSRGSVVTSTRPRSDEAPAMMLREGSERHRDTRAEKRDELTPLHCLPRGSGTWPVEGQTSTRTAVRVRRSKWLTMSLLGHSLPKRNVRVTCVHPSISEIMLQHNESRNGPEADNATPRRSRSSSHLCAPDSASDRRAFRSLDRSGRAKADLIFRRRRRDIARSDRY